MDEFELYNGAYAGLQIDEAIGKVLNPDATPTEGSTNLVQSGGVASAVSAVQNTVSRRNLLDNWYFANPVNQRGLTSYSTHNAYCIDRWKYYGDIPLTLQSGGIRLGDTTSNVVTYVRQFIDTPKLLAGKTLTYSVLVKDLAGTGNKGFIRWYTNNGEQTNAIINGELTTLTLTVPSSFSLLYFDIGSYWNNAFTVVSVKLELGSVSTLANDAPPNYAEELAKCQYYYQRKESPGSGYNVAMAVSANTANTVFSVIPLARAMRYTNSPTVNVSGGLVAGHSAGAGAVSSPTYTFRLNKSGTELTMNIVSASFATKTTYMLWQNIGGYIEISCDL